MVYDIHILGLVIFKFCKLSKKQSMLDELGIHVCSMAFQDNYLITLKRHYLLSDRIHQVYIRYIPGIYYTYTMWRSLASPLKCPPALGSLWLRIPSDLLSFGYREAAQARLGQSKVPQHLQSGVDLLNMAAPPRVRACTISTAALKSVALSAAVLMWTVEKTRASWMSSSQWL
jgi:hypothetical protein